jgi:hypothetical protein
MTPSERRRQSHNWSNIEDALDSGWKLTITKDNQKRRYRALLEAPTYEWESDPFACIEWALDQVDEWVEESFG